MLRDQKVRISILLPPLIQLFVFTFAATLDVKDVPIGILNRDSGEKAFELVERFYGTKIFNNKIIFLKGVEQIAPFMDTQKGVMVVSIDEQFSAQSRRRKTRRYSAHLRRKKDEHRANRRRLYAGDHQPL